MTLTRDYLKQVMAYVDHKLNRPHRLELGGGTGADGGSGIPPGGIIGQLSQRWICYDTTEAASAGSASTGGSLPSLVQNLNRIRGGHAIGDDAIVERHMLWSTGDTGTSGCIDAQHIPFYAYATPMTSETVRDAIEEAYSEVGELSAENIPFTSTSGSLASDNVRDAIEEVLDNRADAMAQAYTWHTFAFSVSGAVSVGTGSMRFYSPCDMTISEVMASCATAPTGQDLIIDVNKNGTTIFTNQDNRATITNGCNTGTSGLPNVTALVKDDYLTMDRDQIGSGVAGIDLTVHVRCKQYLSGV